jgi:hypothetical protein
MDQRRSNLEEKLTQALDFSSVDARDRADPRQGQLVGRFAVLAVSTHEGPN